MKLAGPQLGVRFVLNPTRTTAVVCGVFPPENAPEVRAIAQEHADRIHPTLLASYQDFVERDLLRMVEGDRSLPEPRGVLASLQPTRIRNLRDRQRLQ